MPNLSCSTLAIGARQLVVQLALETNFICGVSSSSFTPITQVRSGLSLAGALRTTFFAPACNVGVVAGLAFGGIGAAGENAGAFDDDIDASFPQGNLAGSRSLSTSMRLPLTTIALSSCCTVPLKRRCVLSYFSSIAKVLVSVRSLIATHFEFAGRGPPECETPDDQSAQNR